MDEILKLENVFINENLTNKDAVFDRVFDIMNRANAVEPGYKQSMKQRDQLTSVALGNFLCLPHGTSESEKLIKKSFVCLLHLKQPFEWDGIPVQIVFALALKNNLQMDFIQKAGLRFSELEEVEKILADKQLTPQKLFDWMNEDF